eukprot:481061-Rhodomonas_salina.1
MVRLVDSSRSQGVEDDANSCSTDCVLDAKCLTPKPNWTQSRAEASGNSDSRSASVSSNSTQSREASAGKSDEIMHPELVEALMSGSPVFASLGEQFCALAVRCSSKCFTFSRLTCTEPRALSKLQRYPVVYPDSFASLILLRLPAFRHCENERGAGVERQARRVAQWR